VNAEDLRELAERATGVEGRTATRLSEVHSRIRSARRRRQAGAVAATVVAVVLAVTAGSAIVKLTDADPPPVTPPSPSPKPKVDQDKSTPAVRHLVWARGSTVHVGNKTIDAGGEVVGVAGTDDGAVFTLVPRDVAGNCNPGMVGCFGVLWFTDGSQVLRIGRAYGSWVRGYRIEVSSAGSTVVWLEPHGETGEYVVYDTGDRREVARFRSGSNDIIQAVFHDYVYWTPDARGKEWCSDYSKYYAACRHYTSVMRLDTTTGTPTKVPWSTYLSDRRNRPRTFVRVPNKPDAPYHPFPANEPGSDGIDFARDGDRLQVDDAGSGDITARLTTTGKPVLLRLPPGYDHDVELFFFASWLDDDHFVLSADNTLDLFVCRPSAGRCRIMVKGPTEYGFGGHG
jgi:hypothetical protein